MSMPNIPNICPDICLCMEDMIKLIISSIALEEISISHLLNAESEKIQYVLCRKDIICSIDDIIVLDKSLEKVLGHIASIEDSLNKKMCCIKEFSEIYNYSNCKCNKEDF